MTRSQLRRLLENADYWRDRETAQREAYILTEEEEMREVNRIYRDMYRWAEREISAFYGRYADAEGIDITEAKKRVSNLDIERYEELAKQYVADKDFSDRANQEMRLYNATMRINRMELLKAQIGLKLVDGFNDIDKHYEKIATDRAVQELERMSGILGNTLTDVQTAKYARNVVNADFYNANFSERIWSHMDNLRNDLAIELQKGFISGVSSQEMARRIKEHAFDKSYKDAHRLVVTELRRVQTDVAKQQYEEAGIEEYEYCAVNPRACPICRDQDGKVFKVSEMRAGENAPPLHPNCHCTTAPKVNEDEYEQWLSWLESGGTTAQWDQMSPAMRQNWYDSIVKSIPNTPSDSFTPAKTKAEAEEYARQFADNVDYSGVSLANANAINRQLSVLTKKYPINTLQTIGAGHKGVMSANYRKLTISGKKLGKVLDEEKLNFELNKAMAKANIRNLESRYAGKNMPPDVQKMVEKLTQKTLFDRWGVHSSYDDHIKCVVTHEYGHILSDQYFGMLNNERANPNYNTNWGLRGVNQKWQQAFDKAKKNGDIYKLSEYGSKNVREFFAESFVAREMGEKLPDYVEDLMAEVINNGIM